MSVNDNNDVNNINNGINMIIVVTLRVSDINIIDINNNYMTMSVNYNRYNRVASRVILGIIR